MSNHDYRLGLDQHSSSTEEPVGLVLWDLS